MKRVQTFLIAVCLVVTMAGLSTVALAGDAVGSVIVSTCMNCGNEHAVLEIISYRQPTLSNSGSITFSCLYGCGGTFTRAIKLWNVDLRKGAYNVGDGDVFIMDCSHTGVRNVYTLVYGYTPPTCTEAGWMSYFHLLSNCTSSSSGQISALGHDYVETRRTPATCTTPGSIISTCSRCNETKTESIPVVSHTWNETSRTPATCLSGSITYTCASCKQTKTETLPADLNAHTWAETSRTPAACLPGSIGYTCSTCKQTKAEPIPALENAHTYEIAEIVPAEYDSDGNLITSSYIRYACSVCSSSYNSVIGGNISGPMIEEGAGGNGMQDSTAAVGKTLISGIWSMFGIYVPGFSFTFGQMWLGVLLASISNNLSESPTPSIARVLEVSIYCSHTHFLNKK